MILNDDHLSEYEVFFIVDYELQKTLLKEKDYIYDLTSLSSAKKFSEKLTRLSYSDVTDRKPVFGAGYQSFVGIEESTKLVGGRMVTWANEDELETAFPTLLAGINAEYDESYEDVCEFDFPLNLLLVHKTNGKSLVFYNVFFSSSSGETDIELPLRHIIVNFFCSDFQPCNLKVSASSDSTISQNGTATDNTNTGSSTGSGEIYTGIDVDNSKSSSNSYSTGTTNDILSTNTDTNHFEQSYMIDDDTITISLDYPTDKNKSKIKFYKNDKSTVFFDISFNNSVTPMLLNSYYEKNIQNILSYANHTGSVEYPNDVSPYATNSPNVVINNASSVESSTNNSSQYVVVIDLADSSTLNLRSSAGATNEKTILAKIPEGTKLELIGVTKTSTGAEWFNVKYKDLTGWVSSSYTKPFIQFKVNGNNVRLRSSYSSTSDALITGIKKTTTMTYIKEFVNSANENWINVKCEDTNTIGWVYEKLLTKV